MRSLRSWILQPRGTDHAKKESRTVAGNSATNPEPGLSWFHLGSILAPACLLASSDRNLPLFPESHCRMHFVRAYAWTKD